MTRRPGGIATAVPNRLPRWARGVAYAACGWAFAFAAAPLLLGAGRNGGSTDHLTCHRRARSCPRSPGVCSAVAQRLPQSHQWDRRPCVDPALGKKDSSLAPPHARLGSGDPLVHAWGPLLGSGPAGHDWGHSCQHLCHAASLVHLSVEAVVAAGREPVSGCGLERCAPGSCVARGPRVQRRWGGRSTCPAPAERRNHRLRGKEREGSTSGEGLAVNPDTLLAKMHTYSVDELLVNALPCEQILPPQESPETKGKRELWTQKVVSRW